MDDIENTIDYTKIVLSEIIDHELYLPIKEDLKQLNVEYSFNIRKESFKEHMETVLDNLKKELLKKSKYDVIRLRVKEEAEKIDGNELVLFYTNNIELGIGDIPIGYQEHMQMWSSGSTNPRQTSGGTQMIREVIVLRPIVDVKKEKLKLSGE